MCQAVSSTRAPLNYPGVSDATRQRQLVARMICDERARPHDGHAEIPSDAQQVSRWVTNDSGPTPLLPLAIACRPADAFASAAAPG